MCNLKAILNLSGEYSVLLLLAYKCRVHYRPGTCHLFLDPNSRPRTNDSSDKWPCGQVGDVGQQHGQGSLCHGPRLNGQESWGQIGQGWFSKLETHFWNVEIFRRLPTLARLPPKSWTVWWDRFVRIGLVSTSDAQNATRVITLWFCILKSLQNVLKSPQITQEVPKSVHLGHIFLLGLVKKVFLHCPRGPKTWVAG